MEQKAIAIKWSMFSLAEAFKKEAEKIGWHYNESFSVFKDSPAYGCLYFSTGWHTRPEDYLFAMSNATRDTRAFHLPQDWDNALKAIDEYISNRSSLASAEKIEFAETLTASVTYQKLIIGCMEVSKESLITLINRSIVAGFIDYNEIDNIPY